MKKQILLRKNSGEQKILRSMLIEESSFQEPKRLNCLPKILKKVESLVKPRSSLRKLRIFKRHFDCQFTLIHAKILSR